MPTALLGFDDGGDASGCQREGRVTRELDLVGKLAGMSVNGTSRKCRQASLRPLLALKRTSWMFRAACLSQERPAKRGSGKTSLKDVLGH
jgi:hypothetical protein